MSRGLVLGGGNGKDFGVRILDLLVLIKSVLSQEVRLGEEWNIGRMDARVKVKDHHVGAGMAGGIYGKDSFEFNDERIGIQETGVGVGKTRIEYYIVGWMVGSGGTAENMFGLGYG